MGTRTEERLRWLRPVAIAKLYPPSRQGGHPTSTSPQMFDRNENLILSPKWVADTKSDLPTDRRSQRNLDF
jgi:hypothetical protein